jgi:hypothetical protein
MVRGLSQRPNLPEDLQQRGTFGGPPKKKKKLTYQYISGIF